jgi:O-antigen/teichoic acid export membrane protein
MAASFFAGLIQGRWMEPVELGRFAFCLSIIVIGSLFFEVGIFSAGARVLALAEDREGERRALGALVVMGLAIGLAFSLFVAAAAFPIDAIFKTDVRWLLIWAAAFAFFQPFQWLIEQSCQGLNRIRYLSAFQLLMSFSYVTILVALVIAKRLNAESALIAYLAGVALASSWTLAQLRPSFAEVRRFARLTVKEVRGYGLNMYLARITGTASARVDSIIITYFLGTAPLGLYNFAQKISNPILTVARSVAITRFRAFARLNRVPSRITKWNAIVLITLAAALAAAGPFALRVAFPKFSAGAALLLPFAAWNLFSGLFQPYNAFLAAHGRGAELRNIALAVTVMSLTGLLLIVPRFGIEGAAWTGVAAMALDYALHLYYYRRFRRLLPEPK